MSKKAQEKYDKENCVKVGFKFNKKTDKEIVEKLNSVPNKQGYIKELIKKDLKTP